MANIVIAINMKIISTKLQLNFIASNIIIQDVKYVILEVTSLWCCDGKRCLGTDLGRI